LDTDQAMANNTSRITRSSSKKRPISTEMVNDSDVDQQGYVFFSSLLILYADGAKEVVHRQKLQRVDAA